MTDQRLEELIPDPEFRDFLGRRLGVQAIDHSTDITHFCAQSSLSDHLTNLLIQLFIDPESRDVSLFQSVNVAELVAYIKQSHRFYNEHYLFKLDHLAFDQFRCNGGDLAYRRLQRIMIRFNRLFRAHLEMEERHLLPYIAFLDQEYMQENIGSSACYALLSQSPLAHVHGEGSEEHQLLDRILERVNRLCNGSRYDFQWSRIRQLILRFQMDLAIHEFIEDEVLLARAYDMEGTIADRLAHRAILN